MVVYNINFNLYACIEFMLELSSAGTILPRYNMQTVQLDLYRAASDLSKVVIEGVLYFGLFLIWMNEFREVWETIKVDGSPRGYFSDFWNVRPHRAATPTPTPTPHPRPPTSGT